MKKLIAFAVVASGMLACTEASGPPTQTTVAAPRMARPSDIAGSYIVTLRDNGPGVEAAAAALANAHGGSIGHIYKVALRGFSIDNLPEAAALAMSRDPRVLRVEPDQVATAITTQSGATWGIDRIDQSSLPLSGTYAYGADGTGVTAYIIDTGINFGHVDFGGRASMGVDEVTIGGTAADCNGHGTHVAGTVGGAKYGVAKDVALVAVRVLDCGGSGSNSGVIAGVDWVTANHKSPAVANMSLGGSASTALDQAIANSVASGVTYGVAAGNGNFLGIAQNACNYSPSRAPSAITVSATDAGDTKASWANYGTCVDIFAPGVSITSSWYTGGTNTISGTSMATPHVVGAAALYLEANPSATPAQVATALTGNATLNLVKNGGSGSPNRLLYTGAGGGSGGGGTPPVASFTYSCSGRSCSF